MSQKVKEVKVWINPKHMGWLDDGKSSMPVANFTNTEFTTKCTLLVPVEEKKVTISEGEFDEAWEDVVGAYCKGDQEEMKRKLFSNVSAGFSGNGG